MMLDTVLVFLGAGVGGAMRHGVNVLAARLAGPAFPWGTLAINVLGSLGMGLLVGWLSTRAAVPSSGPWRLFVATGVLGGFTTFSAFSLDVVLMWERGDWAAAAVYVAASIALSVLALAVGLTAVRALG
jgi:CrcB protein